MACISLSWAESSWKQIYEFQLYPEHGIKYPITITLDTFLTYQLQVKRYPCRVTLNTFLAYQLQTKRYPTQVSDVFFYTENVSSIIPSKQPNGVEKLFFGANAACLPRNKISIDISCHHK